MRYLKVFFTVVILFFIMMLFVQNMSSFSDPVSLKFDPMFFPAVTSMPLPRYSLLLISFALGAALVLFMLIWDRITISSRLSAARRRISGLEKKLKVAGEEKDKLLAALNAAKEAEAAEAAAREAEKAKAAEEAKAAQAAAAEA